MTISAFPTPTPSRDQSQDVFDPAVEAFLDHLPTFVSEANAVAVAMNLNSTTDTSVSSVLIGTGAKTFTVSTGKSFQPGMYLVLADSAAPSTNLMVGSITSYNSGTGALVVNVEYVRGSGTIASWVISQSAPAADIASAIHGATNKTTPVDADEVGLWDSVTGMLNHVTWANIKATLLGVIAGKAVQVDQAVTATTRAATTTLGTSLNHELSNTAADITAFNGVAGVTYHVRALGAGSITYHATNLIITQGLANITTAAGDTFDVEMLTATTSRIKNYVRASTPAFSAYSNANQSITSGATTKITLQVEEYDLTAAFDSTTNSRFQPTIAGYYDITGSVIVTGAANPSLGQAYILKNGAVFKAGSYSIGVANYVAVSVDGHVYLNGTTDYVELAVNVVCTTPVVQAAQSQTYFSGILIHAA